MTSPGKSDESYRQWWLQFSSDRCLTRRIAEGLELTGKKAEKMSVRFRSPWLGFSSFSLFCIQSLPHQLSVADSVVREVPAGSDIPQPSSLFLLVISSTFPFHTRIQLSKGVFSLSLPVKRAEFDLLQ